MKNVQDCYRKNYMVLKKKDLNKCRNIPCSGIIKQYFQDKSPQIDLITFSVCWNCQNDGKVFRIKTAEKKRLNSWPLRLPYCVSHS